MANTHVDGPLTVSGNLSNMPASVFGVGVNPDPNPDAGPSKFYQGTAVLDPRIIYLKDKVTGYLGVEQAFLLRPTFVSMNAIPSALASNNIAAAQGVTSGVAMTLAGASFGVQPGIPIRPFSAVLNSQTPVLVTTLDFGFAWVNCTAGSTTITVGSVSDFWPGMPLVIGGVGNAAGTTALLTNVLTVGTSTIVVNNAPLATNAAVPVGTGDLWSPSGPINLQVPQAAYPFLAGGPGLFLDTRQSICRGVRIVGSSGATGGPFTVAGYDFYHQPTTQLLTVPAGASTVWSLKCLKHVVSVTPNFTDAGHNYSVGTSDVFGFAHRNNLWENTTVCWAGALMTTNTGWTAADTTNPATSATGDVRGTIQVSASGGGTGIGSTVSNGALSTLTVTGNRLSMAVDISTASMLEATQANPATLFGSTQA